MKKIVNVAISAALGFSLAGCNDFLTLVPLNDVVFENFWTDKADVESVLLGAYSALETSDCITRMSVWGEMRSDNIVNGTSTGNDILQITKENLLETNSYVTWDCIYKVINRANTVIEFADDVAAKDPNYTLADLNGHLAEARAIRDLCYFYLIRAYRDVPYVTTPSKDDTKPFVIPASSFDYILGELIADLEEVVDNNMPVKRFKDLGDISNTARFTRTSVLALLADMYLWSGDWQKCIDRCEEVIKLKTAEYKEIKERDGSSCTIDLFNDIPLIRETVGGNTGNVYNEIFGTGNSFESLFELAFIDYQSVKNDFITTYYGSENTSVGQLAAYSELFRGALTSTSGNKFFDRYDCRVLESLADGSNNYPIRKYVARNVQFDIAKDDPNGVKVSRTTYRNNNQSPNWIVYRFTEVLLMEAEAKCMLAKELGGDINNQEVANLLRDDPRSAFNLVNTVYQRAVNVKDNSKAKALTFTNAYGTIQGMEELIMLERRREFLFEGKRWFDLVRMSRRDGNTKRLLSTVLLKFTENVSAIRIKLADMDAIYFPIAKDELKVNTLLKQNPAFVEDEYSSKGGK